MTESPVPFEFESAIAISNPEETGAICATHEFSIGQDLELQVDRCPLRNEELTISRLLEVYRAEQASCEALLTRQDQVAAKLRTLSGSSLASGLGATDTQVPVPSHAPGLSDCCASLRTQEPESTEIAAFRERSRFARQHFGKLRRTISPWTVKNLELAAIQEFDKLEERIQACQSRMDYLEQQIFGCHPGNAADAIAKARFLSSLLIDREYADVDLIAYHLDECVAQIGAYHSYHYSHCTDPRLPSR